jgi:hypothetical protein
LHERFEQYINGSGKIFIQIFSSDSKTSCGKLEVRLLLAAPPNGSANGGLAPGPQNGGGPGPQDGPAGGPSPQNGPPGGGPQYGPAGGPGPQNGPPGGGPQDGPAGGPGPLNGPAQDGPAQDAQDGPYGGYDSEFDMDMEDLPKKPILSQKEPLLSQKEPILSKKEPILSKKEPIKAVEEKVVFQLSQPYSQHAGMKSSKKRSSIDRPDQTVSKKVRSEDSVLQPFGLRTHKRVYPKARIPKSASTEKRIYPKARIPKSTT